MPHEGLGDFEQMVLLAVLRLSRAGEEVYGVPVVDEIERRTSRSAARAAVYITMRRLESKGFLDSWLSQTDGRGVKARRCVNITPGGLQALRASRQAMNAMWSGLDPEIQAGR